MSGLERGLGLERQSAHGWMFMFGVIPLVVYGLWTRAA